MCSLCLEVQLYTFPIFSSQFSSIICWKSSAGSSQPLIYLSISFRLYPLLYLTSLTINPFFVGYSIATPLNTWIILRISLLLYSFF